jgi:hypothetical protein
MVCKGLCDREYLLTSVAQIQAPPIPAAAPTTVTPVTDAHEGQITSPVTGSPEEPAAIPITNTHDVRIASPANDTPEKPAAAPVNDAPEGPATASVTDAPQDRIVSPTTDAPVINANPPPDATTSRDALAEHSAATGTLPAASAPVASNPNTVIIPPSAEHHSDGANQHEGTLVIYNQAEPDHQQETDEVLKIVAPPDDPLMEIDTPVGSETPVVLRSQPTDEDFAMWRGQAMQSLDSTENLNSDFNWLEYRQCWPTKKGAPKREARTRLELFGQQVGLLVNALAAHYEISQSTAWGYTNLLRKEVRGLSDYNIYKAWRASQIRDGNGGKSGKCVVSSASNHTHFFAAGDLTQTSQLLNAEWNSLSDEAKRTAVATAKAELDREQGDSVDQELAGSGKRLKYLKSYAEELADAVRVLISVSSFILTVTNRLPFKRSARVLKLLASLCFRSRGLCLVFPNLLHPLQGIRMLG